MIVRLWTWLVPVLSVVVLAAALVAGGGTRLVVLCGFVLIGTVIAQMNLAIGSALACIGLTVPAVVLVSAAIGLPLVLGLDPKSMAMLMLTFVVSAVTLGTGRTYMMQGAVHLVLFAAFLFLAIVP